MLSDIFPFRGRACSKLHNWWAWDPNTHSCLFLVCHFLHTLSVISNKWRHLSHHNESHINHPHIDIQDAVKPVQLCTNHDAGCEAAIHAMHQLFNFPHTNAVIQVDASNAFNSCNRQIALKIVHYLLPSIAKVLINMKRLQLKVTPLLRPCMLTAQFPSFTN